MRLSNEVTWSHKIGTTERHWQPPLTHLFLCLDDAVTAHFWCRVTQLHYSLGASFALKTLDHGPALVRRRLVVRPRNLGDAPTLVFIGSPLNGEKSRTMGMMLQFCRCRPLIIVAKEIWTRRGSHPCLCWASTDLTKRERKVRFALDSSRHLCHARHRSGGRLHGRRAAGSIRRACPPAQFAEPIFRGQPVSAFVNDERRHANLANHLPCHRLRCDVTSLLPQVFHCASSTSDGNRSMSALGAKVR